MIRRSIIFVVRFWRVLAMVLQPYIQALNSRYYLKEPPTQGLRIFRSKMAFNSALTKSTLHSCTHTSIVKLYYVHMVHTLFSVTRKKFMESLFFVCWICVEFTMSRTRKSRMYINVCRIEVISLLNIVEYTLKAHKCQNEKVGSLHVSVITCIG